jgi:hypothetical protein
MNPSYSGVLHNTLLILHLTRNVLQIGKVPSDFSFPYSFHKNKLQQKYSGIGTDPCSKGKRMPFFQYAIMLKIRKDLQEHDKIKHDSPVQAYK